MGFFDKPGEWINRQIKDNTGYDPSTGQGNAFLGPFGGEGQWSGSKTAAGTPPETQGSAEQRGREFDEAQKQKALRDTQLGIAKDFEDPNGVQSEIYNKFRNERLHDLATDQLSKQRGLARRGLGYGGIAQGANARLQEEANYDLDTGKFKIKEAADAKAQEIRNDALNNAIKEKQTKQVMFEQVYNSAIDAYRQRKQAMKSFGQTVGGIAGTIYGGPMGGAAGAQAGGELTS